MYEPDEPRFFWARRVSVPVIRDLHVSVHAGEIVAIVGASGSGKTLLADSIMGLFEPNAVVGGRIWFDGAEQDAASLAALRGNGISLVPQSVNYLDPLMKVGHQIKGQKKHKRQKGKNAVAQLSALLERYNLPPEVASLYPHELSGGMARRVLLCCALMDNPRLIIADEPTPGLDLELARRALVDFRNFADEGGGVLLITHDIELALRVADRVAVFDDGTVVEETAVDSFSSPDTLRHSFSKALWHALPEHDFSAPRDDTKESSPSVTPPLCVAKEPPPLVSPLPHIAKEPSLLVPSSPRPSPSCVAPPLGDHAASLEARELYFSYSGQPAVLAGFNLTVEPRERVALLGSSGAGKSTLCKLLAGYLASQRGHVLVDGAPLLRKGVCPVQLVWQHPEQALDTHLRMRNALDEAGVISAELRRELGIRDEWLFRHPHELSGGELQRFCIARALAAKPRYLIADEMSTMLDAVTQARVWEVLLDACENRGIGLIFVSHSPALIARLATRRVELPSS
jgi:ABC-type glutathione transport system ATPase component